MFSLLTGVYDSYLAPTQLNLLVVGAPSAGKTTLLERLKVTQTPKRASNKPLHTPPAVLTPALVKAFCEGGVEGAMSVGPSAEAADSSISTTATTAGGSETDTSSTVQQVVVLPKPTPVIVQKSRRFKLSICPAPERYSRSAQDQEEDFVVEETPPPPAPVAANSSSAGNDHDDDNENFREDYNDDGEDEPLKHQPTTPEAPRRVRCHSKDFNVDDLEVSLNHGSAGVENDTSHQQQQQEPQARLTSMESIPLDDVPPMPKFPTLKTVSSSLSQNAPLLQEKFEEYDLKAKAKMLPMSKIRPTIGTNLGKIEMFGAKCHFFDVGGRLQDLWERYYDDCDAVIFCWKLGDDPDAPAKTDDDDDAEPSFDLAQQQEILNQVRKSISDDIPFLIFGHVFGNVNVELVNKMYATDLVLPHYHNNLTGMCCGSAKTGAGVQHAMDWLIPLAKRQQKERLAARRKLEEEKEL